MDFSADTGRRSWGKGRNQTVELTNLNVLGLDLHTGVDLRQTGRVLFSSSERAEVLGQVFVVWFCLCRFGGVGFVGLRAFGYKF